MPVAYIDTNIFVRAFEANTALAQPARDMLLALEGSPGAAVTSDLTLAELFAPTRMQDALSVSEKIALYEAALTPRWIALWPVSRSILRESALLRQMHPQKLPDAIHVATALQAGCRYLVSSDNDMKRLPTTIERLAPNAGDLARLTMILHA